MIAFVVVWDGLVIEHYDIYVRNIGIDNKKSLQPIFSYYKTLKPFTWF